MKPPPPTSTIYVKGFSEDTKEAELLKHFGTIGVIRKHKETGAPDAFLYKDEAGVFQISGATICARATGGSTAASVAVLPLCSLSACNAPLVGDISLETALSVQES